MTEIAYWIDPIETERYPNMIVICLQEVEKEDFKFKFISPKRSFTPSLLRQLCMPKDKEVIEFLIKEELQFQKNLTGRTPHAESTSFQLIHISQSQILAALKLLAITQKLFFNNKQLILDFFGKVEFYYQVHILDKTHIQVSGRLKWRENDISLQEVDFIGPGKPVWFIRGLALKFIQTPINWKNLNHAYQNPSWILEGAQKTIFLDELEIEDSDSPQVVFIGGTQQEAQHTVEPLPLLILKDRVGACADLWMDYGNGQKIAFHDSHLEIKDPSRKIIVKRQLEVEKNWEKDLLETHFIRKNVSSSHYYCPVDKVAKSLIFLLEVGWRIQDWKANEVIRQKDSQLMVDQQEQHFIIKGRVNFEQYEVDITHVLGAFNRRDRFVQILPGKVGLLPDRWEQTSLQEITEEGEIVGQAIQVKRSHFGALSSLFDQSKITPTLVNFKEKIKDFTQIESAFPGENFKGQLRPYQQEGLNWLSFLIQYGFHGILADDMGLGKTVQVLALISRLKQDRPHLIVVPTSLIFNWKNEIEKFLPGITPYIHHGSQRTKSIKELTQQTIIVTSYTTLRLDLPLLENLTYQSIILDEAQVIKNAHTQIAQAVYSLQSTFRLSITGTPIENHLGELWSHFRFLIPDLFGDEETFEAELQAAYADHRYLQRIKRKISPFILRRKKEEVAKDLPERIDQIVWVEMEEKQRQIYDQFLTNIKSHLLKKVDLEGVSKHRLEILEAILRLRQVCCHPLLAPNIDENLITAPSAKFETLERDLETAIEEGRKVLVYSQFTSMLNLMLKMAKTRGWSHTYLDGSTTNREKVVSLFQEDPSLSLFFVSLKAGGVGLNLTAADYVFLYDPWWNEAAEEQAINRAHRIGRKETVIAKRFITLESIEEKMMKLKETKRLLIEEVLEDKGANPTNLTIEDLHYLLS